MPKTKDGSFMVEVKIKEVNVIYYRAGTGMAKHTLAKFLLKQGYVKTDQPDKFRREVDNNTATIYFMYDLSKLG